MAEMMRAGAVRTEPNKVLPAMAKVRTTQNSTETLRELERDADGVEILSLIEQARRRSGLKLEYLATLCPCSKGQLSGALNGNGGFNVRWLDTWPTEFWDEFLPLLRSSRERSPIAIRARRAEQLKAAINFLIDMTEEVAS